MKRQPRIYATVTRYQTSDGVLFEREVDAIARTRALEQRDVIEDLLRNRPDDTDYCNGHGFVQQTDAAVSALNDYISAHGGPRDASDHPVASTLYYRHACLDGNGREWGQPYFAINPHMGKLVSR